MEVSSQYFENKESQGPWGSKIKPKVWYTARTHSQIAQTVNEVRKCDIEGLHVRVMGARDQLCINEQVLEEKDSYVKVWKFYFKSIYKVFKSLNIKYIINL